MHADLKKEREGASFPVQELTYVIDGGKSQHEKKRKMLEIIVAEPALHKEDLFFLSRSEKYKRALKAMFTYLKISTQHNWSDDDGMNFWKLYDIKYLEFSIPLTMVDMAHDELQKKYLPLADRMAITGTYAQTELGHGSNVRGLETTATCIPITGNYDTTFRPGGLGKVANHAVVFARLIVDSTDYGIHPFLVQIRSLKDHKPLPGVTVGDIGPKFGFETVDNGFLRFNKVRIPREQMLMKFAKVTKEGKFVKPPSERLSYSAMIFMRLWIVDASVYALKKALTISIRYSAIRRQFGQGKQETQVLDYQTQQYRLLPYLAFAYALHFTNQIMMDVNRQLQTSLQSGDSNLVPEIHASSSGLKSFASTVAAEAIEQCRLACGGHGYSKFSGLTDLYAYFIHLATAEGENVLLTQQTARFLLKSYQQVKEGKSLVGSSKYLELADTLLTEKCTAEDLTNPQVQLRMMQYRAGKAVVRMATNLQQAMMNGAKMEEAWNEVLIDAFRVSRAHSIYIMLLHFVEAIERLPHDPSFSSHLGDFTENNYLSGEQAETIRRLIRNILKEIRLDAVPLVDAFDISDFTLCSALGRYDGMVYETLYKWAQKEPLNATQVVDGYQEYIKPLIEQSLFKSKL